MKLIYRFSLMLLALLPATIVAHDFEVDGIYYNINNNEATVTYKGTTHGQYSDEYSGDVAIPATVTYNGTTYSVTSIGEEAFMYCDGLTSVIIPNSVTSIGDAAFADCQDLTSIVIPNSVTSIGDYAFSGCWNLTSATIGNSVTSIGERAFENAYNLKNVTIGKSVTHIGFFAFRNTSKLTRLIWNARNCTTDGNMLSLNIELVTIGNEVRVLPYNFVGGSKITSVTIPNSVTTIGEYAFSGCNSLARVTIPNSVIAIGEGAFNACIGLASITVANGNMKYDSRNNCNAIIETSTNTLVTGCKNTVIPNSVTSIGDRAFEACSSLTSITIPNSVTSIGYATFIRCRGLTSIDIPNSVITIGDRAFDECSGLIGVTIGNSVTHIGENAFRWCSSLIGVTIGNSVTTIDKYAFLECNALETVKCHGTVPPVMANADCFSKDAYNCAMLLVPHQYIETYLAADYWYKFAHIGGWDAKKGDVNGDGEVNIADVNAVINIILGGNGSTSAADVNGDGEINIADVNALIDIILSGS